MDKSKIDGYIERMKDSFVCCNFSEARSYAVNILDKDPRNHVAIILKKFIEKELKRSNGRYKTNLSCENIISLINQIIEYEGQNKCAEIFILCKNLLKTISVVPDECLIKNSAAIIESLEDAKNKHVVAFLNYFKKFHEGITRVKEQMEEDLGFEKQTHDKLIEIKEEVDLRLKKAKICNYVLIGLSLLCWVVAICCVGGWFMSLENEILEMQLSNSELKQEIEKQNNILKKLKSRTILWGTVLGVSILILLITIFTV